MNPTNLILSVGVALIALSMIKQHGILPKHLVWTTITVGLSLVASNISLGWLVVAAGVLGLRQLAFCRTTSPAKRISSIGLGLAALLVLGNLVAVSLNSLMVDTSPANLAQAPILQNVSSVNDISQAKLVSVTGGDIQSPVAPSVAAIDPQVPAVRSGNITRTWSALDALYGNDANYKKCAEKVLPDFNWNNEVPKFKAVEGSNNARFILVVNSDLGQAKNLEKAKGIARDRASADSGETMSTIGVVFVNEIINTRGFTAGGCEPFRDSRPMIRISLGQVISNPDGSLSLEGNNGVFQDCHNPWTFSTPRPPVTTTTKLTTTSTTVPVTTTTSTTLPTTTSTTLPVTTTTKLTTTSTTVPSTTTTVPPSTTTTLPKVTTTTVPVTTTSTVPVTTTSTVPVTTTTTMKPPTNFNCQQNGTGPNCPFLPVVQPVQNNTTSGVNTGPTPGAPSVAPTPPPTATPPVPNTPAPPAVPGGQTTGSTDPGSVTGGSGCTGNGCSGGAGVPTSGPPTNTGAGGPHVTTIINDPFG